MIAMPSLNELLGWLGGQLGTWLAIISDTKFYIGRLTVDDPKTIQELVAFFVFVFVVITILSSQIDAFVWNIDILSPTIVVTSFAMWVAQAAVFVL